MIKDVYITGISYRLSQISTLEELVAVIENKLQLDEPKNENFKGNNVQYHQLNIAADSKHYPKASDIKVMRDDVIASVQCVAEILEKQNIQNSQCTDIPLFVANGIFIDDVSERFGFLNSALMEAINSRNPTERNEKIYRLVPPLLALITLTNSTESYVSQYTGLGGNNGTYGNTSQSGFYALKDACSHILHNNVHQVVCGGSNECGNYSYLSHKSFVDDEKGWAESACSAFLLLESEESIKQRNVKPLAKISFFSESNAIDSLFETVKGEPFKLSNNCAADSFIIHSGAFSESEFELEKKQIENISSNRFGWFEQAGNMGSSSVFMNIITSIIHPMINTNSKASLLNRDVYGRESYMEIQKL